MSTYRFRRLNAAVARFAALARSSWRALRGQPLRIAALLGVLLLSAYLLYLDFTVRDAFEGKKFALPARVYARALEVYPGAKISLNDFTGELARLAYRESPEPREPGTFRRELQAIELTTREFQFWDGPQPSRTLRVRFDGKRVSAVNGPGEGKAAVDIVRIEPPLIGGIYPGHNEDRALLRLDQVPPALIEALIAVEDRKFYEHWGVDPRGLARAAYKTVTGQGVQGGSTITQQLVKNFFLTPERTLTRKFNEMLMSFLLELHYDKNEILETYINEIYLGQDANRAIHGFGLASHFYFDRPLEQLELHQLALLVAMVKGPSYYDPRRHPERALARRNLVLQELARHERISQEQFIAHKNQPLGVVPRAPVGTSAYPAFLQLVYRQLRRDYQESDLRSEGLKVFTTLDPQAQALAETALARRLAELERIHRLPAKSLEAALVVTSTQHGEVQALVGGRDPRFSGFNRALDAERPVGSLVKPAVYLAALEQPEQYTLATLLDDSKLVLRQRGTDDWEPKNYDKQFHGEVPLRLALVHSYNVSTARLGLALGVDLVVDRLERLGVDRRLTAHASSVLGTNALSPYEVAQIYQTIADGGFRTPLRAIREITTADGRPLQRYPLRVEQVASAAPVYLLTRALQDVVSEGTGVGLAQYLPAAELGIAGKTGTTDGLRDSWFAGFSGDHVAVAWIGRDDNQPTGLTGASGAMTVWGMLMAQLDPEPMLPAAPEGVEVVWIDPATRLRGDAKCEGAIELPFIKGSAPRETAACAGAVTKTKGWFRRLFE
ncbi:MAG: penicillin-binding protein 1B [Pseudomonadota bacterium]|nr:MAG: penicillin-binding protein 1B [Pseudomonadota bacterium]